jgi:hypothetical protein
VIISTIELLWCFASRFLNISDLEKNRLRQYLSRRNLVFCNRSSCRSLKYNQGVFLNHQKDVAKTKDEWNDFIFSKD